MRERLILDTLAGVFAIVLAIMAIVPALTQDHLFFQSDFASLADFLLRVSWCLTLPLALALLVVAIAVPTGRLRRLPNAIASLTVAVVVLGFLLFLIESTTHLGGLRDFVLVLAALLPAAILSAYAGWTGRLSLDSFRLALRGVLAVGAGLMLWALVAPIVAAALATSDAGRAPTNTIMIVLDSLSQDDLSIYNPAVSTPDFEALAAQSRRFDETRTNYAYTYGFFSAFFSGKKSGHAERTGLLGLLDGHGVKVRWITMHNNGVPRGIANHVGLSGGVLTQHTAPLLRRLGLHHNIFWYVRRGFRGRMMSHGQTALTHLVNGGQSEKSLFREVVPNEVEALREGGRDFFLSVHANVSAMSGSIPRELWETNETRELPESVIDEIVQSGNDYRTKQESHGEQARRFRDARVRSGLREVRYFFDEFRRRGWDRDTLLIVTSDHGFLRYKNGRSGYYPFPDEEVSRVPLLLLGPGLEGTDHQLRQTIDLSETVLERHGVAGRLSPESVSLLRDPPPSREVTTMTWGTTFPGMSGLLSVYDGRNKYVVDLNRFRARKFELRNRFELTPVGEGELEPDDLPFDLQAILDDYGWDPERERPLPGQAQARPHLDQARGQIETDLARTKEAPR